MQVNDFLLELDRSLQLALAGLGDVKGDEQPGPAIGIPELLATALKKELEASEEAALWMTREDDVEVKLALARQCGDEARHYRLIEARLHELGVDPSTLRPTEGGPSKMFHFLAELGTTVERVAAGQFTREALAEVQNRVFIEYCDAHGDPTTASLYRDIIQPDEGHHHEMGRKLLARLATTPEAQELARTASAKTLSLASELQQLVFLKKGIARAPGC